MTRLPASVLALALIAAAMIVSYGGAFHEPFFSDDYILLDKVRTASFVDLLGPNDLAYGYWRPWSRELHFAWIARVFGPAPVAFHAVSGLLAAGVGIAFFAFARTVAGRRTAILALAGLASLAAWGVPLRWGPGAQDLWMLLFVLLGMLAYVRERRAWALVGLAFALLSKETAAVMPGLALAWSMIGERVTIRAAVRHTWPLFAVVLVWFAVHPSLGGSGWWGAGSAFEATPGSAPAWAALRSVLSLVNLDRAPRPLAGWSAAVVAALPMALLLGAAVALAALEARRDAAGNRDEGARRDRAHPHSISARRLMAFGLSWALIAWAPLLSPTILWQPYYTILGACGAWLALGAWLVERPVRAVVFVAAVALLRVARAETPANEWSNEPLQRFGKTFMARTQTYLKSRYPRLPSHARLFFATMPRGVVFVTGAGDAPALRVWYEDPTIEGGYWSSYRPRPAGAAAGPDLFFRYDSLAGWVEVSRTDTPPEGLKDTWRADHEGLALLFTRAEDHGNAAQEYERLARAFPSRADYADLAALSFEMIGDARAAAWFREAAARPGADSAMIARARALEQRGR